MKKTKKGPRALFSSSYEEKAAARKAETDARHERYVVAVEKQAAAIERVSDAAVLALESIVKASAVWLKLQGKSR